MDSTENEKMREEMQQAQHQQAQQQQAVSILDVEINDENTALNVMVQFLTIAQKRGAFNIPESAKIYECLQIFTKKSKMTCVGGCNHFLSSSFDSRDIHR